MSADQSNLQKHVTGREDAAFPGAKIPVQRTRLWRRLARQPLVLVAAAFLLLLVILAIAAPQIAPYDPYRQSLRDQLQGPNPTHWLGTDELGRDALSRIIWGARISLLAAIQGVGLAILLGLPIGMLAGYRGGWFDRAAMWVIDILFALPGLVLALSILAILGPGLTNAMIAVGIGFATRFARLARGVTLAEREKLYIESTHAMGLTTTRILTRHILPNIAAPLIVQISALFGAVLLIEAALSFLGLGVPIGDPSWGRMLSDARNYIALQPFLAIPPGIAITCTVLAFNLLGDGLNDALGVEEEQKQSRSAPTRTQMPEAHRQNQAVQSVAGATSSAALIAVHNLHVQLTDATGQPLSILDDVTFEIAAGETLGLVGESGAGKSMTGLALMGLLPVAARSSGSIRLANQELIDLPETAWQRLRGNKLAMIFQEPLAALNPSLTIGQQIAEPLIIHQGLNRRQAQKAAADLLALVRVPDPAHRLGQYPHQFSGGMAQRAMIARALACQPELLIADEPTTALDVTVQAEILELLADLQAQFKMAILLITHDMGVVARLCHRVAVMYAGEIVEVASVQSLFQQPQHPYTAALLDVMPQKQIGRERLPMIQGSPPLPGRWSNGCRFYNRCSVSMAACTTQPIGLSALGTDRFCRCLRTGRK